MTREYIEQLDDTSPHSFETDREEWWYQIGLKDGLQTADQHPRKGLIDIEKALECFQEYHKKHYNTAIYDEYLLRKKLMEN